MKRIKNLFLIIIGTISLVLGIIGIFVPLLPTTPFLLLSAACYLRSSKKFYDGLLNHRWLGKYITNYVEKKGIPKNTKIVAIFFLWLTIGYSAIYVVSVMAMKIVLLIIAIAVTTHLLSMKTLKE
ncbi:MAG: YbaN family protein [Candidatus Aenigmarchaeota archaeon]|nr:YbaN family protein [Candidatus Aenigmarchaeota archaeon]